MKKIWDQIWVKQAKIGSKIKFFLSFFKFGSLVFLGIAQECSLRECLTTNIAKTSTTTKKNKTKKNVAQIGAEMIFFILMLSSVHSNLLV